MIGPNESWRIEMSTEIKAGLSGANSVSGEKVGKLKLTLCDGTTYTVKEGQL